MLKKKVRRLLFSAALHCVVCVFSASAHASVRNCATPTEQTGLDMQAMQSELMVAALTCNQRAEYNQFVITNREYISSAATNLRRYFRRIYSNKAPRRLNAFVTLLANRTSEVSLNHRLNEYCAKASQVFYMLNRRRRNPVELARYFSHLHAVRSCNEPRARYRYGARY